MSYSFGTPKTSTGGGGFPLGTPTGVQPAPNPGLNFGGGDNKSLGGTPQAVAKPTFGLAYTTPPNSTSGFQMGAPASTAPTLAFPGNAPQNVSFNMPATPASSAAPLTGFSLGSTLGSSLTQTSTPSLLSSLSASTAAPTLSLGTMASSAPSFNLGSATPTTATGFQLGGGGVSSTGLTLATPVASSTSGGSFTLGKVSAPPASAPAGLTLTTPAQSTALTSTTLSAAPVATPAGSFTFSQLEEALNKWTLELEDQGKMFINQALQLNAWDRLVIANGEKILTLNNGIEKVKQQQQQLDHELDFVLAQQRELEECILPLEKELKDIPITDQDRNHTYQMAENMDTQLKQMSEDLKEIIEHLNESNKTEDTNDPVAQIGRILNAHMNSLQWIDRNTAQISTFLDQISKMHDVHRRDNERSFHLTYE